MAAPSTLPSTPKAIRQLVEHYTPDGTPGRLILACATGTVGAFGLWLTAVMVFAGTAVTAITAAPIAGVITALLLVVTVLTVWPVYLSAIGRVDSPTAYSKALRRSEPSTRVDRLTAAYRSGEFSEAELEQRLETTLADETRESEEEDTADRSRERLERATE